MHLERPRRKDRGSRKCRALFTKSRLLRHHYPKDRDRRRNARELFFPFGLKKGTRYLSYSATKLSMIRVPHVVIAAFAPGMALLPSSIRETSWRDAGIESLVHQPRG